MTPSKKDDFLQFLRQMEESKDYLRMEDLKDNHSYKIYARNAYVGIWVESKKAFVISRYKVGPNPRLNYEYHWDTSEQFGTAKPLELIEKYPFEIKDDYDDYEEKEMLKYLDKLEENNPIINGDNSLQSRRTSAIKFEQRLSGKYVKHDEQNK
jgi:hypothetical protein